MTFRTKFLLFVSICDPPNNPITACGATSFPGYHSFPKWAISREHISLFAIASTFLFGILSGSVFSQSTYSCRHIVWKEWQISVVCVLGIRIIDEASNSILLDRLARKTSTPSHRLAPFFFRMCKQRGCAWTGYLSTAVKRLSMREKLLCIVMWSHSVTTTVNKSQRRQAFACRLF